MIFLAILAVLAIFVMVTYNSLVQKRENVRNDLRQIDIQLDRRFKVFESLISAVNKYMDYEKTALKDVIALRNQAQAAKQSGDDKTRIDSENKISQIASGLSVTFEQYPDLKASQNVQQFQEEVVNTENKLSFAKQAYNDSTERFNSSVQTFPTNLIAGMFGNAFKMFTYWELTKEDKVKKEEYVAKL